MRTPLALLTALLVAAACGGAADRPPVIVFAASSLQTALDALAPSVHEATGVRLVPSYGASSTMARQIEQGAPASIFISADREWMDYLHDRSLIETATRTDLLTNDLVVIARTESAVSIAVDDAGSWRAALGDGRLAVADPAGVPAGKYAREALTTLGVWEALSSRLAPGDSVRAALQLVARGEAPLGIVYRTDALAEPRVAVAATVPAERHAPIVYPAALTTRAVEGADRVLVYFRSDDGLAVFAGLGFGTGGPR